MGVVGYVIIAGVVIFGAGMCLVPIGAGKTKPDFIQEYEDEAQIKAFSEYQQKKAEKKAAKMGGEIVLTQFSVLENAEKLGAKKVEIVETETGKQGFASSCHGSVRVFYGEEQSDDKVVSASTFNKEYKVTTAVFA